MTAVIAILAGVIAAGLVYFQRKVGILGSQNEELRDKLSGKDQALKIEKLEDVRDAHQKEGKPDEDEYKAFLGANPGLIPPDDGKG